MTPTQINTGAISTLTGPIASNFESLVPGIRAYFDWINSEGGVNGQELSSPTTWMTAATPASSPS